MYHQEHTQEQAPQEAPPCPTSPEDWEYPVPAGRHPARIMEAEVKRHPKGYNLVCIRLEILDAAVEGHTETKWYHLKSKKAIQFLRRDFARIGFEMAQPTDLFGACKAMAGLHIEIKVDYPSGSTAVYFLKQSEAPANELDTASLWEMK